MIYVDKQIENNMIRSFSEEIDSEELLWHRDQEDRFIKSIRETDWSLQLDNELPISLNSGILIKKESWHRLIKGTGDLTLKIIKIYE